MTTPMKSTLSQYYGTLLAQGATEHQKQKEKILPKQSSLNNEEQNTLPRNGI